MSRNAWIGVAVLVAFFLSAPSFAQMHGRSSAVPGFPAFGIESMGVMPGHDLTVGFDGTVYVLDPDLTVTSSPRTEVIAISPTSTRGSEWRVFVPGLVHEMAVGSDRIVLSAAASGMFGTRGAVMPLNSKLYFLNAANGEQVRPPIEHTGFASSLLIRKIGETEYIYVVTRDFTEVMPGFGSGIPRYRVRLSVYRIDGSIVRGIDLSSDLIIEHE